MLGLERFIKWTLHDFIWNFNSHEIKVIAYCFSFWKKCATPTRSSDFLNRHIHLLQSIRQLAQPRANQRYPASQHARYKVSGLKSFHTGYPIQDSHSMLYQLRYPAWVLISICTSARYQMSLLTVWTLQSCSTFLPSQDATALPPLPAY